VTGKLGQKILPGRIVIVSSPSGGGKTSICRRILTMARRRQGWVFSVSYTTRHRRPREKDGREYRFVSEAVFQRRQQQRFFAESFKVHRYFYGTPRRPLEDIIRGGGVMLLDVDVRGALALKRTYREAITIFILPPSITALKRRLKRRGTETTEMRQVRFDNARREEMPKYERFEYTVVNRQLSTAVQQVLAIIAADLSRTKFMSKEQIKQLLG